MIFPNSARCDLVVPEHPLVIPVFPSKVWQDAWSEGGEEGGTEEGGRERGKWRRGSKREWKRKKDISEHIRTTTTY